MNTFNGLLEKTIGPKTVPSGNAGTTVLDPIKPKKKIRYGSGGRGRESVTIADNCGAANCGLPRVRPVDPKVQKWRS